MLPVAILDVSCIGSVGERGYEDRVCVLQTGVHFLKYPEYLFMCIDVRVVHALRYFH
jgi:hypothetical protein